MADYTHRNGGTAAPTETGIYWFDGAIGGIPRQTILAAEESDASGKLLAWPAWEDGWVYPSECEGRWWGPIVPPWESRHG